MNYYIGIDSGGTYLKGVIYSADGHLHAIASKAVETIHPQIGWVERDLDVLWQDMVQVIQMLLGNFKEDVTNIKGLSISAQGKGVYLLDKQGRNLGNGITSADARSMSIVKAWLMEAMDKTIYPLTRQTLWTGHPVSILRWIKIHQPERYAQIGAILMSHDYLRYRLTEEIAAEKTNISESNLFNCQLGTYDKALLTLFGIEEIEPALARIINPSDLAGKITLQVAKETGLPLNLPIYGGVFDVVATAICSGIDTSGHAINYVMGTWSVTSLLAEQFQHKKYPYVYGHSILENQYIIHEASPTSVSNYEWFSSYLGLDGKLDHRLNAQLVAELPPAESDLYFMPFLYGSNEGLGIKAGLYGLQAYHTKAHIIQAIWEGILFCHYVHLERIHQLAKTTKQLNVTGGASKNETWMQMLADLTNLEVHPIEIEETGALGAVLVAMLGAKEISKPESFFQNMPPTTKILYPRSNLYPIYQKKYQRYRKLVALMKEFERLNEDDVQC